jgi:hypothetical protein
MAELTLSADSGSEYDHNKAKSATPALQNG